MTTLEQDPTLQDDDPAMRDVLSASAEDVNSRTRLLENEIRIMRLEVTRITHEIHTQKEKIKENTEKIKVNKTLPYLVSNVIEILDVDPTEYGEEDGANVDLDSQRKGKCAVIKTSTRQTYFLPVIGLVDAEQLKPGDLVGVNKDSYLILEPLPAEYDSRVKAMEVDERPTEQYSDIGGLDKQIQELIEAVVLPVTHKERFENLGIQPPKGVLLYGAPGTGKTLLARACAAQTKSTFLKLAGPQLVQMFIGDGAKLVRDAFALAKEKAPAIIFIDELDAIGTKRFDSEKAGDREVQRTMLELLNQLDGFSSTSDIKVIAATNRVDILDPALLRSGRLDRKIEFPHPNEEARARIMQIHSRKMNISSCVNFDELARSTDDFNGAQCKAVCVEAAAFIIFRRLCYKTEIMSSPKVLMKPPTLSDDDALDILLKTKLRLEAELEATAENYTLPTLPEDDRLNIAQAVLKKDVHLLQRTLQYFRDMDSTLEKQEQSLSATLERCSDIEAELTKCVETPSSEAEGTLVATRLKGINGVFQAMRAFFRKYLEKLEQERPELKISNALQELCTKMLDSPSDPYIDIVDLDINNETLMFMLMHNLVQRHSHYPSKIRMLDPRKQ